PALACDDQAFALELEIGPLDRDHADPRASGESADRRNLLARHPVPDRDPAPDLLHQLLVHRAGIGLRDGELTVHIEIHSMHTRPGLASAGARGPVRSAWTNARARPILRKKPAGGTR